MSEKILVVDDEEAYCIMIKKVLEKENIEVEYAYTGEKALEILKEKQFNVILLDFKLPDTNGFEFLEKITELGLLKDAEVILVTAYGDDKTGMESIHKGFYDFVAKPFNVRNLTFKVKHVLENIKLREKIRMLSQPLKSGFDEIIGDSHEMQKIFKIVNQVANKDTTILIEGETGTGKELIARIIHQKSKRKDNRFIPVNCGALAESLLESELFGYEKGAFTGAVSKKYGILEAANNGTAFLDEINSASLNVQSKLLRFIETGEFMRVGGTKIITSDTRIISASNQYLMGLIKEKKFRDDLYHRLNVVKIILPPLRRRKEDIPLLIHYFLKMYNKKFGKNIKIYKNIMNYFTKYFWPGNVRQLKNLIQSQVLLNVTGVIKPDDLPETIREENISSYNQISFKEIKNKIITDFEINYLKNLLKETKGNVSRAAKLSKLNRKNLIDKLKIYKINPSEYKF